MLKDAKGHRLYRKVQIKVVFPDNIFPPKTFVQHAGPHQGFGTNGVDDMLMQVADKLDTLYPWWEFRAIELKPEGRTAKYVFTFAGYRSVKPADAPIQEFTPPTQEGSTLDPEAAESNAPTEVGNSLQ